MHCFLATSAHQLLPTGCRYLAGLQQGLDSGALQWLPEYIEGTGCSAAGRAELSTVVKALEAWLGNVPAADWRLLCEAFMEAFGVSSSLLIDNAPRLALQNITLIYSTVRP